MKRIIVSTLLSAGTLVLVSGCIATKQNVSATSSIRQSQYISILKDETTEARERLKSMKSLESENRAQQALIDESVLPLPNLSISATFFYGEDTVDPAYYAEFEEFNVPMAMTSRVSSYIKYFTERVPETTQNWLDRANKYMYLVRDIFVKEGLPTDLVVLGFTESGYNTHAISIAGAVGMWQFIPSTGKIYGMSNNFWLDERRDFEKSTYAAAKYLKNLHDSFDDWYLALAAYNAGPGRIARATKKHGTRDFFTLAQNRYTLKLETRDYVPKFLALLIIYKNYLKYGFTPPSEMPLIYDTVETPSQTNLYWLAKNLEIEVEALMELNPALKLPITPPVGSYTLRVPQGMNRIAHEAINSSSPDERAMYKIYNAKSGEKLTNIAAKYNADVNSVKSINAIAYNSVYSGRPIFIPIDDMRDADCDSKFNAHLKKMAVSYYTVKKGDTFIEIAHKYGMRAQGLQRLNPNINPSRLRIGQQLSVGGSIKKVKYASNRTIGRAVLQVAKYTVRDGDTLWSIAKKFGTTVDTIKDANNLRSESLRPGKILAIKK